MRWVGFMGCLAVLTVVSVSGCKEKTTHITVVQPERTVVREVPVPAEPAPAPAPAPVVEAPAPVYDEPAPPPVVAASPVVVVAPAPVVVEPVVTPAVSVGVFVERLGHHGRWVGVATYGQVWVPAGVAPGWRPYSLGHWVYTDAYGWTWVSDEPWGWATYHYGRWVFLEPQGWVWVPGTVWAPAWVVWRSGGGYVGWAPMPPQAVVGPVVESSTEVNINININIEKHIRPNHWVFVEEKHVLEPVHTHIVIAKRSDWIINVTRPSTHLVESHGRIINRSLAVRDVERATGRPVRSMRVREVDAMSDTRTMAKGDEIVMPRARLRPMPDARTNAASPTDARGTAGRRGIDSTTAQPASSTHGNLQPRGQDAAKTGQTLPPVRTPVTRRPLDTTTPKPAGTNGVVTHPADIKPSGTAPFEPTPKPPLAPTGRPDSATRVQTRQMDTSKPPAPTSTRTTMERKPRLDVKPVPVEKPLDVTTATPGVKTGSAGAAQQGSGNTNTPAPGTIRRADVSRQGPAARDRDVTSDRASTRRGKTETQPPTIAAPPKSDASVQPSTNGTPTQQSNQPPGNSCARSSVASRPPMRQ